jgi:hypothetical protein
MRGWLRLTNDSLLNTPVLWVNKYLQSKILESTSLDTPFFPTLPSTINDLTSYFPTGGTMATWDRLIKMNKKSFPHIKCEQVMYYFYANGENPIEKMVQIQEQVLRLMDRGDETAQEVNNWAANRQINLSGRSTYDGLPRDPDMVVDNMFYFHNFKVYQLEESRDIIDFGTARTYGGNKIIIEYDYHQMPSMTNREWTPERILPVKEIII